MGFWLGEGENGLGTPATKWEQFWREDSILSLNCLWISLCVCVCVCVHACLLEGGPHLCCGYCCACNSRTWAWLRASPQGLSTMGQNARRGPTEGLAPGNGLRWVQASNGAGAMGTPWCCLLTVPTSPP